MANKGDDVGGCIVAALAVLAGVYWFTSPSKDQVCRQHKAWPFDALHGVDGQPTCQELLDQLDAQAADDRQKIEGLESRLSEVETKLNM